MLSKWVATITRRGFDGAKRAMMLVIANGLPSLRNTQRCKMTGSALVLSRVLASSALM